jgi:hypothetical protein
MRRAILAGLAVLATSAVVVSATPASSESKDVLKFDSMAGVTEPFTGATNPVRGVPGGGVPWQIKRADGELRADGRLKLRVEGLVLARRAPVPPAQQGTNPIPQFRAIVSCLTPGNGGTTADTVNRTTEPVNASPDGDARFDTRVDLPHPCIAPIVFVTSPTGAWFAATGL